MTRIIVHEILSAVFLNLLYTSIYSDGSRLYPELNPLVGESFKLVCKTDVTITSTITIKFPDGTVAGTCDPPTPPVPVYCANAVGYVSALNETENAITTSTNSLALDANGTWTCTYNTETVSYNLRAPIRAIYTIEGTCTMCHLFVKNTEIKDETFSFFPTSFTDNITSQTASISLSATYGCINLPVYFKWFVVDSASKKIDISGTSNAAENSSLCTSGFNEYTETKEVNEDVYSSSSVTNLDGSYRLGVEVHYTDEVTTLHSIKYFDTYFVFSPGGANTKPDNDNIGLVIGMTIGGVLLVLPVVWMLKKKFYAAEQPRPQRQQPDGYEGPQSPPKDSDARPPTTGKPLPRRRAIASPQTGPLDSVNSPRPNVLAPIENPNITPSIDTLDEQKTDKKPNDKKKK